MGAGLAQGDPEAREGGAGPRVLGLTPHGGQAGRALLRRLNSASSQALPTPDPPNQNFWEWSQEIWILQVLPKGLRKEGPQPGLRTPPGAKMCQFYNSGS